MKMIFYASKQVYCHDSCCAIPKQNNGDSKLKLKTGDID